MKTFCFSQINWLSSEWYNNETLNVTLWIIFSCWFIYCYHNSHLFAPCWAYPSFSTHLYFSLLHKFLFCVPQSLVHINRTVHSSSWTEDVITNPLCLLALNLVSSHLAKCHTKFILFPLSLKYIHSFLLLFIHLITFFSHFYFCKFISMSQSLFFYNFGFYYSRSLLNVYTDWKHSFIYIREEKQLEWKKID